jgi:pimeloyl-ACP methyl ester carboxylesterase
MLTQGDTPRTVQLDRVKLVFHEEGTGPPLLLLHGLPGPGIWDRLLPHLREQLHCICLHSMVMGASDSSDPSDYALDAQAEWVRRFLDRSKLERVHVLGHDLGGIIAVALATRYPHRVVKMVLSHVPPRDDWSHPLLQRISAWSRLPGGLALFIKLLGWEMFAKSSWGWGEAFFDPDAIGRHDLAPWNRLFSASRGSSVRSFLREVESMVTPEILDALKSYQRPTMLLWGCDYLPLSPSWAIQLYHDIPGATRFELIPFSGHFPQWENPEAFARAVLAFILAKPQQRSEVPSSVQDQDADPPEPDGEG